MINKICHFSDLHIRLFKDHELYKRILIQMLEKFREIQPDRIVFTGDLVHSKNQLTPELLDICVWLLNECSSIAKTILIFGNHDGLVNNDQRMDSLSPIIDSMNNPNILYYRDRGIYEDENVSWCVYSQYQGNTPPEINNAKGHKVGLFHGPIQGLSTDLGFNFGEEAYDIQKFAGLEIVLCGDIHKRSVFKIPNNKKGFMIGSTIQNNFGESITKHGFGLYNISKDEYVFVDLENPRPFISFYINSFEVLEKGNEKIVNI
jgi:DNA repair exonuclease SbcCD nuclease subunit